MKTLSSYKQFAKHTLLEAEKFQAKSTSTGRVVNYGSKDSMDAAIKGGKAKPLDKKKYTKQDVDSDMFAQDTWDRHGDEEPSGEPEGGEQNIPSNDEIDSYQEKLNTYTGPYSDGNEIHTHWEGITAKAWAETSEEAYKDDPDHPLNKPSDSEWHDTVGEEVRGLASAHFSDFGDELKDASPEAKAYFKEKGLPPSGKQGRTGTEVESKYKFSEMFKRMENR